MSVQDFCAPDSLISDWSAEPAEDYGTASVRWLVDKNRKKIVEFIVESLVEPVDQADASLERRFMEQADRWDSETAHLSSPAQRFLHPSYVAIMGMAQDNRDEVIRLLLRDMENHRREWFWALSYLTHENPIDRRDSGNLDRMIRAWVRWGKKKGLR